MSRTKYRGPHFGRDFWSRRAGCIEYGPVGRHITKRIERARTRRMIQRILNDPEDFDSRFKGE